MITLDLIVKTVFAAVPAVGFGMVFNVPSTALIFCALGGMIGYFSKQMLMSFSVSIELATFCAALLVGFMARFLSKKYLVPQPVYAVASIIPMIPGTCAFTAMIALIDMNSHGVSQELTFLFFENGLKAMFIVGAISLGLTLPSLGSTQMKARHAQHSDIIIKNRVIKDEKSLLVPILNQEFSVEDSKDIPE
jgi:uncharacterized membrane protein YjjB (DUF3815 family)